MLAALTVIQARAGEDDLLGLAAAAWWLVAFVIGVRIGRRTQVSPSIERALREARVTAMLPDVSPGRVLLNRLWPLFLATVGAAVLSLVWPQVTAVAAGFGVMWSLSWRRQEAAVTAIEERDAVTFYVQRTSPTEAIKLIRAPGFKREHPGEFA